MLTTDELKAQLNRDAAEIPSNAARLDQVHGRVTRRRRQRAQLTGALAVVAIGAAVVVLPHVLPGSSDEKPTIPAVSPSGSTPLADYSLGGHLIAQTQGRGPEGLTVMFTPSNKNLTFVIDCYLPGSPAKTMVDISIDGKPVSSSSCGEEPIFSGGTAFTPEATPVTPGTPAVLRLTYPKGASPLAQARIGIYEAVPLADYPLPPEPTPLPSIDPSANLDPRLHSDPLALVSAGPLTRLTPNASVGPNGSWSDTFRISRNLSIEAATAAPGTLRFLVDGREIDSCVSWTYGQSVCGLTETLKDLGIKSGQSIKVEIRAERFPGDSWAVLLSDGGLNP